MAKESMKKLNDIGQERRKRPKDTSSSAGVSPRTAAAWPPAKRTHLLGKHLFTAGDSIGSIQNTVNNYKDYI